MKKYQARLNKSGQKHNYHRGVSDPIPDIKDPYARALAAAAAESDPGNLSPYEPIIDSPESNRLRGMNKTPEQIREREESAEDESELNESKRKSPQRTPQTFKRKYVRSAIAETSDKK